MTEVETSLFGEPTLLLGDPAPVHDPLHTPNAAEIMASGSKGFVSNGLLGDAMSAAEDTPMEGVADERRAATSEGFGAATLLDGMFASNGLLDLLPGSRTSTQGTIRTDASTSQSQEEEFPSIKELLRPYTSRRTEASTATTNTTIGIVPLHLSRLTIRATTFDGKAVFLRKKLKKLASTTVRAHTKQSMSNLLDVPIHRLLDDLSSKVANKLAIHDEQPEQPRSTSAGLWTETYRPKRYTDLLGDDRVHREVMLWVKEWDYCVFGKKKGKKRARDDDNPDEYRRPRERLMLISGPAGLGKTTLAHVVAKQAGYDVLEINASDARTASVVDELIRPALESGSKINSKRPTLIVVDEIDGATGSGENSNGFISRLIQLTHDKPKKRAKKGEAQGNRPLLRPIICICNELYANSLSKLRPHARIIRFNRPNDFRLVNRLRDICEIEGLKAESRALTTLVGLTQGDLRGCLNTLELIRKNDTEVTENAVRKAAGMKLGDVSQATVLNDLFSPMSRKRVKDLGVGEEEEARYVGRLSRNIEACGAMDKVAIGCFEHYVTLRKHDANFSRYLKANEWLSTYDLLSGEMRSEREYTILQYLPYMVVPFYPLFQERGAQKVERPKADWENYTQTQINEEVYNSLADCLRTASTRHGGAYRHLVSKGILQLEFAPMINRIISPPLRPVNQQVIKPDERAVLSRLVDIMATLQLRFVQEKSEEGQLMYRLEPPIDTFVTYDAKRASDIAVSRYAVRHLVASEIDARLIHHQVEAVEKTKSSASNLFTRKSQSIGQEEDDGVNGEGKLLTGRSASAVIKRPRREEVIEEKAAIDFFGRPIVVKTTPKIGPKSVSRKGLEKKPGVSYRFNEGNSAAVRKPVKVNTFL